MNRYAPDYLRSAYGQILKRAAELANAEMRNSYMQYARGGNLRMDRFAALQTSWSPWQANPQYGLSLKLRDADRYLMEQHELWPELQELARRCVTEAIMEKPGFKKAFVTGLMRDMTNAHYYKVKPKDG